MNLHTENLIGQNPGQLEITEYNATAAALVMLREKYGALPDITAPEGLATAKAARAEIRVYRSDLEKMRRDLKAPLAARSQLIDSEAERIKSELMAVEEPIDAAIKAEERRQADEKAAQKRAEAERRDRLLDRVNAIRGTVAAVADEPSGAIRDALTRLKALELDPDELAEFWPEAKKAASETVQVLETLLAQREKAERWKAEEEARIEEHWQALARQRDELAWQRAEEAAQRLAEQAELARLRAAEDARRQTDETGPLAQVVRDAAEAPADPAPAPIKGRKAKADPLTAIKNAFAAGTLSGADAIDCAYRLGFKAGERGVRKAA